MEVNVNFGQHIRRDVSNALLLSSLFVVTLFETAASLESKIGNKGRYQNTCFCVLIRRPPPSNL
jgi:hypothetical protein